MRGYSFKMEWKTLFGTLSDVPSSGRYCFPRTISYTAQFASPELIAAYCHEQFDGRHDPRWREFGTDEIGERHDTPITHKGGHIVLVHGFEWSNQGCQPLLLHNSSGRFPELQEHAVISSDRFAAAFAGRGFAFWPTDEQNA